jgi:RNA polymerase sigma factor (sigma-70 family)
LDPTDWELVQRSGGGDHGSFHVLVDRHAQSLYELAAMMIGNTIDAQDIVQETLLAAFSGLRKFEGRAAVKTWLVGILVRQVAVCRRGKGKRRAVSLDVVVDGDSSGERAKPRAAEPSVKSEVGAIDARLDLMEMMAKLSDEHREVVVLRELVGLTYEEIADLLGVPRGTVESRLFRARRELSGQRRSRRSK